MVVLAFLLVSGTKIVHFLYFTEWEVPKIPTIIT